MTLPLPNGIQQLRYNPAVFVRNDVIDRRALDHVVRIVRDDVDDVVYANSWRAMDLDVWEPIP